MREKRTEKQTANTTKCCKFITEEVRSTQSTTGETNFNAGANIGHSSFWSPVKVDFNTSLSTKHSSTGTSSSRYSTEATMNIHVRAVQDGIPAGMSRILTILEAAIKEKVAVPPAVGS